MVAAADFTFRPARAIVELETAESTLAQMTVPFAVTIYNEYLIEVVGLYERLAPSGLQRVPDTMMLGELVQHLNTAHGVSIGGRQGELLGLLSHLRNRIVHYGGRAGAHLIEMVAGLSTDARGAWIRVAGHPFPTPAVGEVVRLSRRDAAAALATVDHAASELNLRMQVDFPLLFWADLVVEDYQDQFPQAWHSDDVLRRKRALRGYAKRDYDAVPLAADDIEEAVERAS